MLKYSVVLLNIVSMRLLTVKSCIVGGLCGGCSACVVS